MSTPFDESKVKRDHGRFAPKGYADAGQLDLGPAQGEYDPAWGEGVQREVDENGNVFYRVGDDLHREDGPAYTSPEGTKVWYRNNLQHRTDGPAVIYSDGTVAFYLDGEQVEHNDPRLTATDPAWGEGVQRTFTANGTVLYQRDGILHRDDGPALETATGSKVWYKNGLRHREGAPAAEMADGTLEWADSGMPHRLDGPALIRPDGSKSHAINGEWVQPDDPRLELG